MARQPSPIRVPVPTKASPARIPVKRKPLWPFDPAPDPLADTISDDPETDAIEELNQLHAGFRARKDAEALRFKNATDTGYYFVVVFETREQAQVALNAMGCTPNNGGDLYVDGRALAEKLGVELPKSEMVYKPLPRPDKKLGALVRRPKP